MQTTLLGIAITLILALLAALVGPLFIDWSHYRGEFEASARRLTGLEFRVTGPIDVRLLPTPTLTLRDIEFGQAGSVVHARALHIEFALPALMRRELRVEQAELAGPQIEIALDEAGRLLWPAPAVGSRSEPVTIERLRITGGQATLSSAATGSRIVLQKLEFAGALRSLMGPLKGDGSFVAAERQYSYRTSLGAIAENGSAKLRLNIDGGEGETVELDAALTFANQIPQVDGTIAISHSSGRAAPDAASLSWHASTHVKGDGMGAVLDQVELEFGSGEQAIRIRGEAKLGLGKRPELTAVLSARQLDLDRVLSLQQPARGRPLEVLRALAQSRFGSLAFAIPTRVRLNVDALTLAGGTLQQVSTELSRETGGWILHNLDLRAPGVTHLQFSGRLDPADSSVAGSANLDCGDLRALLAWLTSRADLAGLAVGALHASSEVSINEETIAINGMSAQIDRVELRGSVIYSRERQSRPRGLDATLAMSELDVGRVITLAKAIMGDVELEWPRDGLVSLKVDRATLAGIEAKNSELTLRLLSDGIAVEQLRIGEIGGASLALNGRIDTPRQSPRGSLAFELSASSLDGLIPLIERFAPESGDRLRALGGRLAPLAFHGGFTFDAAASVQATTKFNLEGTAGSYVGGFEGEAAAEGVKLDDLSKIRVAGLAVAGRVDASDGRKLIELIGLDRLLVTDEQPGRLVLTAKGSLEDELAVDSQLTIADLGLAAQGVIRAAAHKDRKAALAIRISNAKLRSPQPAREGRPPLALAASGSFELQAADGKVALSELKGTVAGELVRGRLDIDTGQQPIVFNGELELSGIDLSSALETAAGAPAAGEGETHATNSWRTEPFERGQRDARGDISIKIARVALRPDLAATDLQGTLYVGETQVALRLVDATVAGGHTAGEVVLLRDDSGLIARSRMKVMDANAVELSPGGAVAGRLTLDVALEGTGLSPMALVQALHGEGKLSLTDGRLAALDPTAFAAVIQAVDSGTPIDAARVGALAESALARAAIPIRRAQAGISIEGGQLRMVANPIAGVPDVELAVTAAVNIVDATVETRLILSALPAGSPPASAWPELTVVLRGPLQSPKRVVDAAAFTGWLALRAVEQQSKKLDVLQAPDRATEHHSGVSNRLNSPAPQP